MAAALEFFGNLYRFTIAAAQAGDDYSVGAAKERQQDGVLTRLLLQKLVDDEVVVANDGIHEADLRSDLADVLPAPGKAKWVLDVAFDFHDPEQRVIEKLFDLAANERVEVPELVNLDEVGVVAGQHEVGVVFEEQVGDVAQMHETVQLGRTEALLLA